MFSGFGPPILPVPPGTPTLLDEPPEKEHKPNMVKRFFSWIARLIHAGR
jgi:hypothetical protein